MTSVNLRPITPEDERFLRTLYASTRLDEIALTGWDEATIDAFLDQQFTAQHAWYQEHYEGSTFDVVECDGRPIGRLYVGRWEREIRIIDIALLPEYRGSGIGSVLIGDLLAEAGASGRKVSIHVEMFNPALRLYERLGFQRVSENGPYYLMEWTPGGDG